VANAAIGPIDFDHFAVAGWSRDALNHRWAAEIGASFLVRGLTAGISANIMTMGNGVKFEVMEPREVEIEDFLVRFLERHGEGFHHITFVVPDVGHAARVTEERGYQLMGSRTDFLAEVFLHPRQALGVVIQYVEPRDYSGVPRPADWPVGASPASLDHTTVVVPSLVAARALYVDLLGGTPTAEADDGDGRRFDVAWRSPGTVRVVEPAPGSPLHDWLGDRPGGVHHIALGVDDPATVSGAHATGDGAWVVEPVDNHGVRLHLRAR
jgi:methylmalonyl-CoA/ethylmalonyl-CoA epimerase